MESGEERMKILKMIEDGKITAAEGARLLSSISESRWSTRKSSLSSAGGGAAGGARWLHIHITDMATGKPKATVKLPLGLVDAGLNIASQYAPGVAFEELLSAIEAGAEGKIIDVVDEIDGERVEIFIE